MAKQKFYYAVQPFPGAIGAVDCTHIKSLALKLHEEAYVRGHYEGRSLNVRALCGPGLLILNISGQYPGFRQNAHICENSSLRTTIFEKSLILMGQSNTF